MSPALAGRFSTTAPPGKPKKRFSNGGLPGAWAAHPGIEMGGGPLISPCILPDQSGRNKGDGHTPHPPGGVSDHSSSINEHVTRVLFHFISAALGSCEGPPGRQFGLRQPSPFCPPPPTRSPQSPPVLGEQTGRLGMRGLSNSHFQMRLEGKRSGLRPASTTPIILPKPLRVVLCPFHRCRNRGPERQVTCPKSHVS